MSKLNILLLTDDAKMTIESPRYTCLSSPLIDSISMYFIINNDLNMNKGKMAAQVAHASSIITRIFEKSLIKTSEINTDSQICMYRDWIDSNENKIVLDANTEVLINLCDKYCKLCVSIYDVTNNPNTPGPLTVLGFYPMATKNVPIELKHLKQC